MLLQNAFLGSLVADAVSMPVHWYYDVKALDADYDDIADYRAPHNPHPDSILWRSSYEPINPRADILHGQQKYWGKRGIHYHQNLKAGDNTLNLQLAAELYLHILREGDFRAENWLKRYVEVMLTPEWHDDTYAEEYHRAFFSNYASGKKLLSCGIPDYHIGSLSLVPALLAGLEAIGRTDKAEMLEDVCSLVRSTHNHPYSLSAGQDLARTLLHLKKGHEIRESLTNLSLSGISVRQLQKFEAMEDRVVVGEKLSTACYLPESLLASCHFAWKYHDDFSKAVFSNALVGGDNCHRGVVVGAIVASQVGIPNVLLEELRVLEKLSSVIDFSVP